MAQLVSGRIMQHKGLRQFAKFCIIGATSATIDIGIFIILVKLHWNPTLARICSVAVAVVNGFIWNSRWTFRGMGAGKRHAQFVKFAGINVVGLALNLMIMNGVFYAFAGRFPQKGETDKLHLYLGLCTAIVIVSCWNFLANKKWTFAGSSFEDLISEKE